MTDHAPPRHWRHLNVCQLESEIVCAPPRGECLVCGKIYTVRVPWEGRSKHFTQGFEGFALTLMREMPVKTAGEILGEGDHRLWRMLFAPVDAAYAPLSMAEVGQVGAEEMNRRKGHHYLTVFADLEARRVLFATLGQDADTFKAFVDEQLKHNGHPEAITQVALDMSRAYIQGAQDNLGNAAIVFDKFHVLKQAGQAVDQVRQAERQVDRQSQSRLHQTMWRWRKNPEHWTAGEDLRWDEFKDLNLATAHAYQMRLVLSDIYQEPTPGRARKKFTAWMGWVREEAPKAKAQLLAPMVAVAAMIERHLEGILAHWTHHLTTAFWEGLNSLFSAVKRRARGYRCPEYMITMLSFVAGKLLSVA